MSEDVLYRKVGRKYVKYEPKDYDEFREFYWHPGLWLIQRDSNCRSRKCITKLCDIPAKPERLAGLLSLQDELANHILQYMESIGQRGRYTISDLSGHVLQWLDRKMYDLGDPVLEPGEIPIDLSR